jgi:hypothetical protein
MTTRADIAAKAAAVLDSVPAPLHVPEILTAASYQLDTPANREWLAKTSGIAYTICYVVPQMIFKNPLKFLDEAGEEHPEISKAWQAQGAGNLWASVMSADTIHGWALPTQTKVNPLFNLGQTERWKVLSTPHVVSVDRDAEGNITCYYVDYYINDPAMVAEIPTNGSAIEIVFEVVPGDNDMPSLHVESNAQDNHFGVSVVTKSWSHLIFLEWAAYLTILFDCYLKPLLVMPFPQGTKPDQMDSVAADLSDIPFRQILGAIEGPDGKSPLPQYVQPSADSKFGEHIDAQLRMVATDAGLPVRFLTGDPKGALAAASEDGLDLQNKLETKFQPFAPFIHFWCEMVGIIPEGQRYAIQPDIELRMSDKDKKEIELLDLQKVQHFAQFMKLNEIREYFDASGDVPPLAKEEGGDLVPNQAILGILQQMGEIAALLGAQQQQLAALASAPPKPRGRGKKQQQPAALQENTQSPANVDAAGENPNQNTEE